MIYSKDNKIIFIGVDVMKISNKDYIRHHDSKEEYYTITYESGYSSGQVIVKTSFYNEFMKRFNKVFKDCTIRSMRITHESI